LNKSFSGWGQGYFTRGFYYLSELDANSSEPRELVTTKLVGVILPEAVLLDALQWRTDQSDRPVRTNGKRPNYQQIVINLFYVFTHTSRRLRLSSLCAYYFFARKSFSEPGRIRPSTRHLEWQKAGSWSKRVPIAFLNLLTWCNDTYKYSTPFKYWGLPHSSPLRCAEVPIDISSSAGRGY